MTTHKTTARDFFLQLLSTVTLYMSVISFVLVVFSIIEFLVPDALDLNMYYSYARDAVRTPTAILFVSFPVFAWSVWFLNKLGKNEPDTKDFVVRKWLMYLTMFLAALIMIITLITVVSSFLNGEFTLRFLLKVLTVLLVSAGVFYYYLSEVRDGGQAAVLRGIEIASVVLVIASIVGAFFVMGSPTERRERRFDEQRVMDLQNIQYGVQNYYSTREVLPATITEVTSSKDPNVYISSVQDPVTRQPYRYEVTGTSTYSLCATFTRPSVDRERKDDSMYVNPSYTPYGPQWSHDAGEHCFELVIDPAIIQQLGTKPMPL